MGSSGPFGWALACDFGAASCLVASAVVVVVAVAAVGVSAWSRFALGWKHPCSRGFLDSAASFVGSFAVGQDRGPFQDRFGGSACPGWPDSGGH